MVQEKLIVLLDQSKYTPLIIKNKVDTRVIYELDVFDLGVVEVIERNVLRLRIQAECTIFRLESQLRVLAETRMESIRQQTRFEGRQLIGENVIELDGIDELLRD